MVKLTSIIIADIKELWQIKIFRVRIFFAIVPTIAAAVFGFLAADNTHPFDYIAEGSYIKPPTGRPGEQVIVSWSVRQNRSICPGIVTTGIGFTIIVCRVVSLQPLLFVAIAVATKLPATE